MLFKPKNLCLLYMDPRLVIPGVLISMSSFTCPNLKSSASNVKFRPPGWVFGVVWPILYACIGLSWSITRLDIEFFSLIVTLCMWLTVYSCFENKRLGVYILMLSTFMSSAIMFKIRSEHENGTFFLMIPLTVWLAFATYLNYAEIRLNKSSIF